MMQRRAPNVYAALGDTAAASRVVRSMEANKPPPWYADAERATMELAIGDTGVALSSNIGPRGIANVRRPR